MFSKTLRAAPLAISALLLTSPPAASGSSLAPVEGPLARAEFDKELSLDVKNVDMVTAFRSLARATGVPFVIDFENDPTLRVTFKAENMVSRGILASLASSYGLEFSASDDGIVVRRPGAPSAAHATTLGAWPARSASPSYRLAFIVRGPDAQTKFSAALTLKKNIVGKVRVNANGQGGVEVTEPRGIAAPSYAGGFELRVAVEGEADGALGLLTELVTSRPLTRESYAEDHTVRNRRVAPGETLLARTPDGHEVVLSDWTKVGPAETNRR